jgi:hypothetical protein
LYREFPVFTPPYFRSVGLFGSSGFEHPGIAKANVAGAKMSTILIENARRIRININDIASSLIRLFLINCDPDSIDHVKRRSFELSSIVSTISNDRTRIVSTPRERIVTSPLDTRNRRTFPRLEQDAGGVGRKPPDFERANARTLVVEDPILDRSLRYPKIWNENDPLASNMKFRISARIAVFRMTIGAHLAYNHGGGTITSTLAFRM